MHLNVFHEPFPGGEGVAANLEAGGAGEKPFLRRLGREKIKLLNALKLYELGDGLTLYNHLPCGGVLPLKGIHNCEKVGNLIQ